MRKMKNGELREIKKNNKIIKEAKMAESKTYTMNIKKEIIEVKEIEK